MRTIRFAAFIGVCLAGIAAAPAGAQTPPPSNQTTASNSSASVPMRESPTAYLDCPLTPKCPTAPAPGAKIISLQLAYEGALAALDACADIHFGGGSVAVLDNFGIPIIALSQPGARGVDVEVARRKAYSALRNDLSGFVPPPLREPTTNASPAAAPSACPGGATCSTINGVVTATGPDLRIDPLKGPVIRNDPYLVGFGGGSLIRVNGQVLGAIGVTGVPPKDVPCAKAGEAYIEEKLTTSADLPPPR